MTIAALTAAGEMVVHVYTIVTAWHEAQGGVFDLVSASTTSVLLRTPVTALALIWAVVELSRPIRRASARRRLWSFSFGDLERGIGFISGALDE